MTVRLDAKTAATIAQGCAASAYDVLAEGAAPAPRNGKARPPVGRYWAAGGVPVPVDVAYAVLHALVVYLEHEPDAPAEALYSTACAIVGQSRGPWTDRPEPERLAFEVFRAVARPLLAEVAAARRAAVVVALPPPVNKGLFKRAGKVSGRWGRQLKFGPGQGSGP